MNLYIATKREVELYEKVIYVAQDRILNALGRAFGNAFYLKEIGVW